MEMDELKDCSYRPSKMTREEIQKYADELGQQYFPNEANIWARPNYEAQFVSKACMRMAKHIEQELIKKACEWLSKALDSFYVPNYSRKLILDTESKQRFIEHFKKAMEE